MAQALRALIAAALLAIALASPPAAAVAVGPRAPSWAELSPSDKEVLAPLAAEWDSLDVARRQKWMGIAKRYPKLAPAEQQRVQEQMGAWVRLTPDQRRQAREQYKSIKQMPPEKRQEVQQKWCDHVVPVDSGKSDNWFAQDAKKGLVAYSFFSPNMDDDGHDSSVRIAGEWLKEFLDKSFPEKVRQGTLVIVTFDESGGNSDNRIFTLFFGDMVKPAREQDPKVLGRQYNHYSLLAGLEDYFTVSRLGHAVGITPLPI